jgi:hypothetical protein
VSFSEGEIQVQVFKYTAKICFVSKAKTRFWVNKTSKEHRISKCGEPVICAIGIRIRKCAATVTLKHLINRLVPNAYACSTRGRAAYWVFLDSRAVCVLLDDPLETAEDSTNRTDYVS